MIMPLGAQLLAVLCQSVWLEIARVVLVPFTSPSVVPTGKYKENQPDCIITTTNIVIGSFRGGMDTIKGC